MKKIGKVQFYGFSESILLNSFQNNVLLIKLFQLKYSFYNIQINLKDGLTACYTKEHVYAILNSLDFIEYHP